MNTNVHPVTCSGLLPDGHAQRGESDLSTRPLPRDLSSLEAAIMFAYNTKRFVISQHDSSAICKGDSKPRNDVECVDKKCFHRITERKRRQDMKSLYSQLRSLLPHENIKGRTSISDLLLEAKAYIRHLQEKIDHLAKKRDEMRIIIGENGYEEKFCNYAAGHESEVPSVIHVNRIGSRAVITTETFKDKIGLSKLLLAIEDEGLQVLTATSLSLDHKILHTVRCKEVSDMQSFNNGAKLHQKLWQLMGKN